MRWKKPSENLVISDWRTCAKDTVENPHVNGTSNIAKKIIIRNFYCELTHQLDELGPLPPGRKSFKARQARQHLQHLGFVVVGVPCSLVTNSSHRDHRKREINYNSSDI